MSSGTKSKEKSSPTPSVSSVPQTIPANGDVEFLPPSPLTANLPDSQAIVQLQRIVGNRAVASMLNGSNAQQPANGRIQRLMSASAFKAATSVSGKRRSSAKIDTIDSALKKIEQVGMDLGLLSELQDVIDHWLSTHLGDTSASILGRRPGVLQLRNEVSAEIKTITSKMSEQADTAEGGVPQGRSRRNAMSFNVVGAGKKYKKDFSDFDSKQFRVSGRAPMRNIEEVKRTENEDGKIEYYATGLVTGFNGKAPVIIPYPEPISLGDWYPQVTHINGMAVAPKSGIQSAMALQEAVNSAMGGEGATDVAMGQDAVDVLYTYSAQRGGLFADVWDCIKGKVGVEDPATEKQVEIMMDAVHRKKRVTVSAHSRGTIKTDNAVKEAHKKLSDERVPLVRSTMWDQLVDYWKKNDPGIGLDPELLAEMSLRGIAEDQIKTEMNQYLQLIYAGNAVQYPSSIVPPTLYAGGLDMVSFFVGSYTKLLGNAKSPGFFKGHGFVGNYVPTVSKEIAQDLKGR